MKKLLLKRKNGGYTIIETMIAISLFIIIVMAGMGALLNANLLSQKSKDMRSIIDNLSFIMEDMSRSLRTGYDYKCFVSSGPLPSVNKDMIPQNCSNGGGWAIAFKPQSYKSDTDDNQWVYAILDDGTIRKSTDNGVTWIQMTPNEVRVTSFTPFTVSGAMPLSSGNEQQPFVTIKLSGEIKYKEVTSPFSLQTSVSQRKIDF